MALIRDILVGFVLLSFISAGFLIFLGSMNTNYGKNFKTDDNSEKYLQQVDIVTGKFNQSISSTDVSQGGIIGGIGNFVLGGVVAAGLFATAIVDIPMLTINGALMALETIGLGWIGKFVIMAISIIILFALIQFLMGRKL